MRLVWKLLHAVESHYTTVQTRLETAVPHPRRRHLFFFYKMLISCQLCVCLFNEKMYIKSNPTSSTWGLMSTYHESAIKYLAIHLTLICWVGYKRSNTVQKTAPESYNRHTLIRCTNTTNTTICLYHLSQWVWWLV